jgi:Ca2+:H+ antiporter
MFVFVQTVRHRDYFLPVGNDDEEVHAAPPPNWVAWTSL